MALKPWLARTSIAGAAVLVVLGASEAALQIVDFPRSETPHQRLFVEYDETRGWRNIPNARGRYSSEEYSVYLQYNSHGIRGPERTYAKPAEAYRIVVVGDSFVDGYSVEAAERATEVLEKLLTARMSRPVEVIALGTAGYSTDQELLWLESEGIKYRPDLVVLMFYYNDIWFNHVPSYWRGAKPFYVWNDAHLTLTNVPVPRKDFDESRGTVRGENSISGFAGLKLGLLVSHANQIPSWSQALGMRLGLIPPRPDENRPERYGVPVLGELTVYAKNPSAETAEAWSVTRGLLKQMKEDSESHGANFLIFHVPARMSIYAGEWEGFTWNYALAAEDWDARQVSRDLMQFCDRESIRCIDPTDQFVETTKALAPHGSRLYYQRDEHWNPNGHRLAATVLADYVSNQLGISP